MTLRSFAQLIWLLTIICLTPSLASAATTDLASAPTGPTVEEARRGIPIIYGTNNEIKPSKVLKGKARKFADKTFGKGSEVGFYYEGFHIFFINFWTWGGKFVMFSTAGQSYVEPNDKQWAQLLGKGGINKLSRPFSYKFPTGLLILGGLLTVLVGIVMFVKPDDGSAGGSDTNSGGPTDLTGENGFDQRPGQAA